MMFVFLIHKFVDFVQCRSCNNDVQSSCASNYTLFFRFKYISLKPVYDKINVSVMCDVHAEQRSAAEMR